jgi:nucleoside-diphosphate-sugar epimerase
MRVCVTGGAGFIGSHVVEQLVHLGAHVTVLDNLSTGSLENINVAKSSVRFIQGSVTDYQDCLQATHNAKIVFHLAALVSVQESVASPLLCHTQNVTGTATLLEACRENKVERFVFSSSSAVYGNLEGIATEDSPCKPLSPYGFSKLIGETVCKEYAQLHGLQTICLRYFNVYGPRQNPHGSYAAVVPKFQHQLAHNLPITIFGDGTQTRDFIRVEDVAKANLAVALLSKEQMQGTVFNIGTGKSITLLALIEKLKAQYPQSTSQIQFLPARSGDIVHSIADCRKYQQITLSR